jgi:hypothetical protein
MIDVLRDAIDEVLDAAQHDGPIVPPYQPPVPSRGGEW